MQVQYIFKAIFVDFLRKSRLACTPYAYIGGAHMLIKFEVENYRSISDNIIFSMAAIDQGRKAARKFPKLESSILSVAGVFGPNASGKSNLLEAIAWLGNAVATSLRSWTSDIPIPTHKFNGMADRESSFEVDFISNNVRHTYSLSVNSTEVVAEALYSYPSTRRRTIFERDRSNVKFRREVKQKASLRELLTPTTLLLSVARRYKHPDINPAAEFFCDIAYHTSSSPRALSPASVVSDLSFDFKEKQRTADIFAKQQTILENAQTQRSAALSLLRHADLGIIGVDIVSEPDGPEISFVHRSGNELLHFSYEEESAGTRSWFELIGPTLHVLKAGGTLLFDEIDASLHPYVSTFLLDLFNDPETNPRNAQLIFASHDMNLLSYLNRDEVWFTEKNNLAATTLTAVTDFGADAVRQTTNLQSPYLAGRFGAVPLIEESMITAAVDSLQKQQA